MLTDSDIKIIRQDFPILQTTMNGKPLIYLDNGATTQKPWPVIKAIENYYINFNSNAHRGFYELSEKATFAVEEARKKVSSFIGANSQEEVIFNSGATEGANTIAFGLKDSLKEDEEILIGELEHNSQASPWIVIGEEKKLKVNFIPFNEEGLFDINSLSSLLTPKTRIVAVTYVSNYLGTIQPIKTLVEEVRKKSPKAIIILDATQAAPYFPLKLKKIDVDFAFFSGHKMLAPMGIGVLWGKKENLEFLTPLKWGGGALEGLSAKKWLLKPLPYRLEAGTPNIEGIIGLKVAIDYLEGISLEKIVNYEKRLLSYIQEEMKDLSIFKTALKETTYKIPMLTGALENCNSHDVVSFLDAKGIALRSGSLCAYIIANRINLPSAIRASFYFYNTLEEADTLKKNLIESHRILTC